MFDSKKYSCHGPSSDVWLDKDLLKEDVIEFQKIIEWCKNQFGQPPTDWEVIIKREPIILKGMKFSFIDKNINFIRFKNKESYTFYKLRFE